MVDGDRAGATLTQQVGRVRALPLARLDAVLAQAWDHRLTLIVAPAGSGKSTLLARFVAEAPGPVAWYRADAWDRDPVRMLRRLESALRGVVPALAGGWETMDDALDALATIALPAGLLLVVDDLHALAATDAERGLERLIERAPSDLTVIAASRIWPDMNLPRFKVAGELLEIGVDDLRFRSWEVERLFRDVYGQHLPPEEVAALTRRTEGWAAGLQLFHLASRGKPPAERRALLARLGRPASRLTGEYLSRNVLAELPEELGAFLVGTSVLGRLTGPLCDELLGVTGSAARLRDLEARCLFTLPLAEPGAYRYHEVFRLHLLGVLVESVGEAEARHRHLRAGELLTRGGALPEALDALCRAEAWSAVAALLGRDGVSLAAGASAWTDAVPPSMLRTDPWLILARARALRAQGRFREAAETYAEAETAFGDTDGGGTAAAERLPLLPWLDPDPPRVSSGGMSAGSPSVLLRAATVRDPALVAARPARGAQPADRLVAALAMFLAGDTGQARGALGSLLESHDAHDPVTVAAELVHGVARLLAGDAGGTADIEAAISGAESLSLEWLERIARACLTLGGGGVETPVVDGATTTASPWVSATISAIGAWTAAEPDGRAELLGAAATGFRRLGAPVLEAWLLAFQSLSMASADDPETEQVAQGAEALARTTGVPAARGLAQIALAAARGEDARAVSATAVLADAGLLPLAATLAGRAPALVQPVRATGASAAPRAGVEARCFGHLELVVDGQPVDVGAARPRVRSLLRLLLSEPGAPFHQEVITEAFWPETAPDVGARNLHAAVAALRRLVEPGAARGGFRFIVREGPGYRFVLPPGSRVDLLDFDAAVARARAARASGDGAATEAALRAALECHRGDLLADEGPASWLEEPRERRRRQAVDAAATVAACCLDRGELEDAARVCADGLRIDRYHDPLWRMLIAIRERAGDAGAARLARQGYGRVLTELGVPADS